MLNIEIAIEKLLLDYHKFHSDFQIENFIVGKAGNCWAQYKQALIEIDARKDALVNGNEELELARLSKPGPRFVFTKKGRTLKHIKYRRWKRSIKEMEFALTQTDRELTRFVELAVNLKKEIGDLGNGKRELLESDSWRQKALKMAGIDLLVNKRVGQSTMELILALPSQDRQGVLKMLAPDAKSNPFDLIGIPARNDNRSTKTSMSDDFRILLGPHYKE